jgi:outer membrane lipoprotein-sorting protein
MSRTSVRSIALPTLLLLALLRPAVAEPNAAAPAAQRLTPLLAQIEQTRVIQAEFFQTKTLRALKRPLRTSGRLVFVRGQGVLWQIDKPYRASYLIEAESVLEISADGTRRIRPAREVPALAQTGQVFQAIFQGDTRALEAYFEIRSQTGSSQWQVDLTAKPMLARFLKSISAHGGRFLDAIEIEEAGGDTTRIEFRNTQLDAPIADADRELFRH